MSCGKLWTRHGLWAPYRGLMSDAEPGRVLLSPKRFDPSGFEGGVRGPWVLAGVDRGRRDEPGFVVGADSDFPFADEPGFPVHQSVM